MIKLKRYKAIQNSPKRGIKKDSIYFSSPSGNKFSKNYIGNEKVYINSYDNYIETCDVTLDFIEYLGCLNRKIFFEELGAIYVKNKKDKRDFLNGQEVTVYDSYGNKFSSKEACDVRYPLIINLDDACEFIRREVAIDKYLKMKLLLTPIKNRLLESIKVDHNKIDDYGVNLIVNKHECSLLFTAYSASDDCTEEFKIYLVERDTYAVRVHIAESQFSKLGIINTEELIQVLNSSFNNIIFILDKDR